MISKRNTGLGLELKSFDKQNPNRYKQTAFANPFTDGKIVTELRRNNEKQNTIRYIFNADSRIIRSCRSTFLENIKCANKYLAYNRFFYICCRGIDYDCGTTIRKIEYAAASVLIQLHCRNIFRKHFFK